MKNERVKKYRFWFTSELSLKEIGDTLLSHGVISDFHYDYENVYEWVVAQTDNKNIELNISRNHNDMGNISREPITTLIMYSGPEPNDKIVEEKALKFANYLQTDVSIGTIEHLGGNDYKYHEKSKISA